MDAGIACPRLQAGSSLDDGAAKASPGQLTRVATCGRIAKEEVTDPAHRQLGAPPQVMPGGGTQAAQQGTAPLADAGIVSDWTSCTNTADAACSLTHWSPLCLPQLSAPTLSPGSGRITLHNCKVSLNDAGAAMCVVMSFLCVC